MFIKMMRVALCLICLISLNACSKSPEILTWQEEVKLLDGRVIVVNQQRRYEGGYSGSDFGSMPRESWLTVKLPETGNQETTWHEKLDPSNINIANGNVYIVAQPMTTREYFLYGQPRPPYIGYVFENKVWRRIAFNEIPVEIYDTNLSIDSEKYIHAGQITLADKAKEFSNPRMEKYLKRIDPNVEIPGFPKNTVKVY
jgi:hypothetical protein